jgi:hypothetical protein
MPHAACAGLPAFVDDVETPGDVKLRRKICGRCPEREVCLDTACRTHPTFDAGVWGGTTPRERARLRADRGITFLPVKNADRTLAGLLDPAFRSRRANRSSSARRGAA